MTNTPTKRLVLPFYRSIVLSFQVSGSGFLVPDLPTVLLTADCRLFYCSVVLPFCRLTVLSFDRFIVSSSGFDTDYRIPFYRFIVLSFCRSIVLLNTAYCSAVLSFYRFVVLSFHVSGSGFQVTFLTAD